MFGCMMCARCNFVSCCRYFAGWCDKITGSTVETTGGRNELGSPGTFAYTVKEPIGVVGQIVPWKCVPAVSQPFVFVSST